MSVIRHMATVVGRATTNVPGALAVTFQLTPGAGSGGPIPNNGLLTILYPVSAAATLFSIGQKVALYVASGADITTIEASGISVVPGSTKD